MKRQRGKASAGSEASVVVVLRTCLTPAALAQAGPRWAGLPQHGLCSNTGGRPPPPHAAAALTAGRRPPSASPSQAGATGARQARSAPSRRCRRRGSGTCGRAPSERRGPSASCGAAIQLPPPLRVSMASVLEASRWRRVFKELRQKGTTPHDVPRTHRAARRSGGRSCWRAPCPAWTAARAARCCGATAVTGAPSPPSCWRAQAQAPGPSNIGVAYGMRHVKRAARRPCKCWGAPFGTYRGQHTHADGPRQARDHARQALPCTPHSNSINSYPRACHLAPLTRTFGGGWKCAPSCSSWLAHTLPTDMRFCVSVPVLSLRHEGEGAAAAGPWALFAARGTS